MGERPPGTLICPISASSFKSISIISAPRADKSVRHLSNAWATGGVNSSCISVLETASLRARTPLGLTSKYAPESTASMCRQSLTLLVIAHTVSSERESSKAPSVGTLNIELLNPTNPQSAAGIRMEPPVSEPIAATLKPRATETAAPELEPPGMRWFCGSWGFCGVPQCGLIPTPEKANSLILVLPITAIPACRKRLTISASLAAGWAPFKTRLAE